MAGWLGRRRDGSVRGAIVIGVVITPSLVDDGKPQDLSGWVEMD